MNEIILVPSGDINKRIGLVTKKMFLQGFISRNEIPDIRYFSREKMGVFINAFYFIVILRNILSVTFNECRPYYHFWRPYYGSIPDDAFRASERSDQIYISKIIPLDENSWSHAAPNFGYNYVAWQWPKRQSIRVDEFMEILCTEHRYKKMLQWRRVPDKSDMHLVLRHCCPVESGLIRYREQDRFAYIGRAYRNGTFFVGPVFLTQDWYFPTGLYSVDNWQSIHFPDDFEILHYGCNID